MVRSVCGIVVLAGVVVTLGFFSSAFAQEAGEAKEVKTTVSEASMFKNGLAMVTREFVVTSAGKYLISDVPEPVHGTFWVHSDLLDEVRVTTREVKSKPSALWAMGLQESLVGSKVTMHLKGGTMTSGAVLDLVERKGGADWDRRYERPRYGYYGYGYRNQPPPTPGNELIAIKTSKGVELVRISEVIRIEIEGRGKKLELTTKKPVLIVKLREPKEKGAVVRISYLTKGLTWAPAYRINLLDEEKATIEQQAVIKNELENFKNAKVQLVSGFPSMRFGHVVSPLSPTTNLTNFFNQLAQRAGQGSSVAMQQAVAHNVAPQRQAQPSSEVTAGEGIDLHYQDIGRRTMAEGDSLYISVAKKEVRYKRMVEWIIPDTRNERGRYVDRYQRERNPEKFQDALWDAIRFKNPFDFPLTTAPAAVFTKGAFSGQQMCYWTDPGEQTTVPVTKALSIRASHTEHEVPGTRERIYVGGNDYQRTRVEGMLTVNNHRKKKIVLVIRRRFSGELRQADLNPEQKLLEEGAHSVNKRNELLWTLTIKPGEKVIIKYSYELLVDI